MFATVVRSARLVIAGLALVIAACASSSAPDTGLETLGLTKLGPKQVVPGSDLVVFGQSFVDTAWGKSTLVLKGATDAGDVEYELAPVFVDYNTMKVEITDQIIDDLGGDVDFAGTAILKVVSEENGETYETKALTISLAFRRSLSPSVTSLNATGVIFTNDEIIVQGADFLLGGGEGNTVARVTGCFQKQGSGTCVDIGATDVEARPQVALERNVVVFPFSPRIAGIEAGAFRGAITLVNQAASGAELASNEVTIDYDLVEAQVFRVNPTAASLGQYVFIEGAGFVGGEAGAAIELNLVGMFSKNGGDPVPVSLALVPEFVAGRSARYVMNVDDTLGRALDLYRDTGTFTGTIQPVVTYGGATVTGPKTNITLQVASVRQVVFLDFRPTYVEALRDFGLRAVDAQIRDRIIAVVKRAYDGVNVDVRTTLPTDFAKYSHVELHGVDPNGEGLFGYDNTPGKDNNNQRLFDRLGGVNAVTQQDGYKGFGGVFLRSMFGFSNHPGALAKTVPGADPMFDTLFDPFRPDLDKSPVVAADLRDGISPLTSGAACPGSSRQEKIECAIFVLGNLVGGTLAHEIGHSLGLANPNQSGFHNEGDEPNRLMDGGGDRSFMERAELNGEGPGVFCDDEYAYLREILPLPTPAPDVARPTCF